MKRKVYIPPELRLLPMKSVLLEGSLQKTMHYETPDDEDYWARPEDAE